ncbi:hypothetical protein GCM10028819_10080 [Spirosoma humi]
MENPVQTVQITEFAEITPSPRSLLFFTPLLNQQGHLVDLQVHSSEQACTRTGKPNTVNAHLSDWMTPQATPFLNALWRSLEKGISCRLTYQLTPSTSGQAMVTPINGGYLVEFFTPDPTQAADPLRELVKELTDGPSLLSPPAAPLPQPLGATPHLWEEILSNTPVGLALLHPLRQRKQITDFVYLLTNPANAAMTGRSMEEMVGQTFKTLFPGTIRIDLFERLVHVAQSGIPQQYQEQVEVNGISMWGQFSLVRVGENVLFTVMDISALKQTQALLDQKNAQLEKRVQARSRQISTLTVVQNAILKHGGQAIISTSVDAVIQTANEACEKLLGYSAQELLGQSVQVRPGSGPNQLPVISFQAGQQAMGNTTSAILQNSLNEQEYTYLEGEVKTKTGMTIPILLAAIALQDEQGVTIGYLGIASNISALKTTQARLRQKNRELSSFFVNALDMHCISTSRGVISKVNKAFQTALGYSAAELKAIPFLQLIHPDEQEWVYQHRLKSILQQPVRNQINRMRCKDGTYRIIEWNAIGIEQVVYGSAHDITERQQTELDLRNLTQRLQLATQAAGQGIWEHSIGTHKLMWDDRLWQLYGLAPRPDGWSFEEFIQFIHPEDLPSFLEDAQQPKQPSNRIRNEFRIIRPDGAIRFIETNGLVVQDEHGRPARTIGVAWDITRRKLAEAALRESEQRFREIADNVDEVFWIHSADPFRLLYINPAYERIWNRTRQSIYDDPTSFMEGIVNEDRPAMAAFFQGYRGGQEGQLDYRLRRPDGSVAWLSVRTFTIRDTTGKADRYIGIVNDITSQKEKELVLKQSLEREQELNQLKSQFVSTASHEFRTPLTTIQTSVDLIELYLDVPTGQASIRQLVEVIGKEIGRVSELLSDMLTIGKIEAGRVSLQPRWLDPIKLCTELIATHYSGRPDQRKVQFQLMGDPYLAYLDEKLMRHVLINLVSNAFKFSTQDPQLTLCFLANELRIEVSDSGIGIPAQDIDNLFQAFFRASNTMGIPGTGLGLVIARQYVELHQGRLTVQSEIKQGTTFAIHLPTLPEAV